MIGGKRPMIPDVAMGMIDVRDVARLHVKAMTAAGASGKRFIAATAEPVEIAAVARMVKEAGYSKVPSRHAPSFLLKFMSLFDSELRGMIPLLGKRAAYDNRATFDYLDWKPTPIETSIKDMAATISTEK
jgi:dihydroflavonol-4-reductase